MNKNTHLPMKRSLLALAVVTACLTPALAQDEVDEKDEENYETIMVTGRSVTYANNSTSEPMKLQQSSMTSALAVIDNLPGVNVTEGGVFGSDEWSTSISMRGLQLDLASQQIGMTLDGVANGNSNYGGGTKANRFIDTENLAGAEVSQGTADIGSRSNEALGGTINFTSVDPLFDEQLEVSTTFGQHNAQKLFARYNTGEILPETFAWLSIASQQNDDFMDGSVTNTRDHFAGKFISRVGEVDLTGYFSYDDAEEFTHQRIYGLAQFAQNSEWDQLTSDWTGIPYQDQAFRQGWVTHRENFFSYLQADFRIGHDIDVSTNAYYHQNSGRGDWIPFYVVDVFDDGAGNPHSELDPSTTVRGGEQRGLIYFVDSQGRSLSPIEGCSSSISFPYGGGGPEVDPGCYEQGARPVSSHRYTNYHKERQGISADFTWNTEIAGMPNTVRGGFWYEDYTREEFRSWHTTIDAASSWRAESNPYWIQYDRHLPGETVMVYAQNELETQYATLRFGVKRFDVDVAKEDQIDSDNDLSVNSDSGNLFNVGFVAPLPLNGLEIFGGYAENFAAVKDAILEPDNADVSLVEPETADNIDLGLRYSTPGFNASLTYYDISFKNRITFVSFEEVEGIDFLASADGAYINDGGVDSSGIEASVDYRLTDTFSLYASYTYNDSKYVDDNIAGNRVLGSAENMGVISLNYDSGDYFAGVSTKYVGNRFMDQQNAQKVDSYIVTDLYLGARKFDIGAFENVEFRLTINNLFDEKYLGSLAPGAGWIAAPRTAALNARFAF